jgi:hypothetical protein
MRLLLTGDVFVTDARTRGESTTRWRPRDLIAGTRRPSGLRQLRGMIAPRERKHTSKESHA